jgi:hypothetical protein
VIHSDVPNMYVTGAVACVQVVMQTGNLAAQRKLAQLPTAALHVLLDSNELKAASENTVIAAVTYWLKQEGRATVLDAEQQQQLAYRLRLLRSTPWYLTRTLMDDSHWLCVALSGAQKVMLTAVMQNLKTGDLLKRSVAKQASLQSCLFGPGEEPRTSWFAAKRPASTITSADLSLEVSLAALWEGVSIRGPSLFYNGTEWSLLCKLVEATAAAKDGTSNAQREESAADTIGLFICHRVQNQPISFSCTMVALAAEEQRNIRHLAREMFMIPDQSLCGRRIFSNKGFVSAADASNKLSHFIHADGKLHFRATITDVQ